MSWQGYEKREQLGPGFFSATRLSDGAPVLLREFELSTNLDVNALEAQFSRLAKASHPSLATPIDWKRDQLRLALVYARFPGKPLKACLAQGLSVRSLINALSDVVEALEFLHVEGFVHGGFDRLSVWRSASAGGVLFTPNIVAGVAPIVQSARPSSEFEIVPLLRAARSEDMERFGLFALWMLRGSSAFSLPPTPSEADIARLLHESDRPLVPILMPLLSGTWNSHFLAEFRDAVSLLELRDDWPFRHVHTGTISHREISEAMALAPPSDRPTSSRARKAGRGGHGGMGLGFGGTLMALLILVASATAFVYMSPNAQDVLVQAMREVGVLPEPFTEGIEGLLVQGADSSSGLAVRVGAYRRVLLRTPGHPQAMAEFRQLIASTREEIGVALGEGRLDFAGRRLGEALNLFPQDSELRRQLEELSERRLAQTLFENTLALLQEGQFTDEEGLTAIQAYREVARLWPGHEGAENALLSMARYFADKARVSIEGEEVAHAMRYLGYATNADSEDEQVASVRQQIQSAQTMRQEVESLLESASRYLASGTLVDPPGANAAESYGRVLATDTDNSIAQQGLLQVTSGVIEQIGSATTRGDYAEARRVLARANQTALDESALSSVAEELDAAELRAQRLAILLHNAEDLLAAGFITAPAEENLMAKLFEVQTLDADNQRAADLRQDAAIRLAEVAEDAWNAGLEEEAREYLGLALTLSPDNEDWIARRESWSLPSG